jgi:hypothetical protein
MGNIELHRRHQGPTQGMRAAGAWRRLAAGLLIIPFLLLFYSYQPADGPVTEYKLKAAFMYNFIQYIDWNSATPGSNEFIIGIIGHSDIDEPLHEIALSKTGSDKKIIIRHFNTPEEITFCHILFIPRETPIPLNAILAKVPKGTLTVSEKRGYARQGTAINFVLVDNKLKFESNLKALNASGLKASSQLLKLAIIVSD